jgi:hypothetical protein
MSAISATASTATSATPSLPVELRHRIASLRAEIAAAEAKIPRTREAIRVRTQTLSRLEARLALEELRPARPDDE